MGWQSLFGNNEGMISLLTGLLVLILSLTKKTDNLWFKISIMLILRVFTVSSNFWE